MVLWVYSNIIDQHQGISTTLSYRPTASFDVEEIFGAVIETGQIISLVWMKFCLLYRYFQLRLQQALE